MNNREISLRKGGQTYVFRFDDASRPALLGVLGRFAADAGLNFSWHDAAVMAKQARGMCPAREPAQPPRPADRFRRTGSINGS